MSPQELEEQRLLLEAIDKIPSARVLVLIAAGFSGIFSSAWWIGLDSAPDRHTGKDQIAFSDKHNRGDDAYRNGLGIRLRAIEKSLAEHETRLDTHGRIQEHKGADRRMTEHDRRLDQQAERSKAVADEIFRHTRGTEARVLRISTLEKEVAEIKRRLGNK
jgi:hypothetical protein